MTINAVQQSEIIVAEYSSAQAGGNTKGSSKPPATVGKPEDGYETASKPKKYDSKVITYTIKDMDRIGTIAREHGTTVASILELNPGLDPNKLYANKTIKIDALTDKGKAAKTADELKAKQKEDAEIAQMEKEDAAIAKAEAAKLQANIIAAKEKVTIANSNPELAEQYAFNIAEDGKITITLKEDTKKTLGQIKEDFNIPDGTLTKYNDIYKKANSAFSNLWSNDTDRYSAKPGVSFVLPPAGFNPEDVKGNVAKVK